MSQNEQIGLVYLSDSALELAQASDDVRGLPVVTAYGHRLGEVDDLVVDPVERRTRLLSVVSGGILGLGVTERLIPVETVTKIDDRVHVDRHRPGDQRVAKHRGEPRTGVESEYEPDLVDTSSYSRIYERYDVEPFWSAGYITPYFHAR